MSKAFAPAIGSDRFADISDRDEDEALSLIHI